MKIERIGHNSFPRSLQRAASAIGHAGLELVKTEGHITRWSNGGTPHLIGEYRGERFSVCYFKRLRKYKVFVPYPSRGRDQHRATCQGAHEMKETIERAYTRAGL